MMTATLLGIGKFDGLLTESLEFPADHYEDTGYGKFVVTFLFPCRNAQESLFLAEALGISPWDFNNHFITYDPTTMDFAKLRSLEGALGLKGETSRLQALGESKFTFFYVPSTRRIQCHNHMQQSAARNA